MFVTNQMAQPLTQEQQDIIFGKRPPAQPPGSSGQRKAPLTPEAEAYILGGGKGQGPSPQPSAFQQATVQASQQQPGQQGYAPGYSTAHAQPFVHYPQAKSPLSHPTSDASSADPAKRLRWAQDQLSALGIKPTMQVSNPASERYDMLMPDDPRRFTAIPPAMFTTEANPAYLKAMETLLGAGDRSAEAFSRQDLAKLEAFKETTGKQRDLAHDLNRLGITGRQEMDRARLVSDTQRQVADNTNKAQAHARLLEQAFNAINSGASPQKVVADFSLVSQIAGEGRATERDAMRGGAGTPPASGPQPGNPPGSVSGGMAAKLAESANQAAAEKAFKELGLADATDAQGKPQSVSFDANKLGQLLFANPALADNPVFVEGLKTGNKKQNPDMVRREMAKAYIRASQGKEYGGLRANYTPGWMYDKTQIFGPGGKELYSKEILPSFRGVLPTPYFSGVGNMLSQPLRPGGAEYDEAVSKGMSAILRRLYDVKDPVKLDFQGRPKPSPK